MLVEKESPGSVEEAAELTSSIPDLASNPTYTVLHERLRHFLIGRASFLLERYGPDELASRFGDDICAAIVRVDEERQDAEKRMAAYRSGAVVEPTPAPAIDIGKKKHTDDDNDAENTVEEGAADHNDNAADARHGHSAVYYPLPALLRGVRWPPEVDPTQRERYLHPSDFHAVFGMTLGEFAVLKPFRQMRLKKERGLF
jgi:hypothetical protein